MPPDLWRHGGKTLSSKFSVITLISNSSIANQRTLVKGVKAKRTSVKKPPSVELIFQSGGNIAYLYSRPPLTVFSLMPRQGFLPTVPYF